MAQISARDLLLTPFSQAAGLGTLLDEQAQEEFDGRRKKKDQMAQPAGFGMEASNLLGLIGGTF